MCTPAAPARPFFALGTGEQAVLACVEKTQTQKQRGLAPSRLRVSPALTSQTSCVSVINYPQPRFRRKLSWWASFC